MMEGILSVGVLQHNMIYYTFNTADCISGKVPAGAVSGAPHYLDEDEEK